MKWLKRLLQGETPEQRREREYERMQAGINKSIKRFADASSNPAENYQRWLMVTMALYAKATSFEKLVRKYGATEEMMDQLRDKSIRLGMGDGDG